MLSEKLTKNRFAFGAAAVFNSRLFPIAFGAMMFIIHALAIDVVGFCIAAVLFTLIALFCEDTRPQLAICFMTGMCVSTDNSNAYGGGTGYYSNPVVIGTIIAAVVVIVAVIAARLVIFKEYKNLAKKRMLFTGLIVFGVACLAAGLFSTYMDFTSFAVGGLTAVVILGLYVYFSASLGSRSDNIDYLMRLCVTTMLLVAAMLGWIYVTRFRPGMSLDSSWKNQIILGALVSNSAGEMMVMMLPAIFYLAVKEKCGWIYLLLSALTIVAVYFTLSRAALLVGILVFVAGIVYVLVRGKTNRRLNLITTCCLVVCLCAAVLVTFKGNLGDLFEFFASVGFSDRGRFNIWKQMLELFASFPVFGAGFSAFYQLGNYGINVFHNLAHNTVVQMIGSCGIVGIVAYVFHRVQTVMLFLKKRSEARSVVGIMLLCFLAMALLDQIFFFPNFAAIYASMLVVAEKDYEATAPKQKPSEEKFREGEQSEEK